MSKRVKTTAAELRVDSRRLPSDLRKAERTIGQSSRRMQRSLGSVRSGAGRAGGMAAGGARSTRLGGGFGGGGLKSMAMGAAAFGGVYGIQNEIKKAKAFEETLVDLAVRGQKSKRWLNELRTGVIAASNEYGVGKEQIAAYVGTIIDQTGNTELAVKTMKSLTSVSYSTNTGMQELAGTVVEMQSKLALAPKQFEEAFGVLAAQADKGKVPLSAMAQYLPEILNATTVFRHKGVPALREYGAALQMAARGSGTLAEAVTSLKRTQEALASKQVNIEKALGIKLKEGGKWKSMATMLKLVSGRLVEIEKAGGKIGKGRKQKSIEQWLFSTFGKYGVKAMLPMMQQARIGFGGKVGGGMTSFNTLIGSGGANTIQERVARKRKLSPELDAWNKSVEQFKNTVHKHAMPALKELGKVMPDLAKGATWLLKNWKLILAVWGGAKMTAFLSSLIAAGRGGGGGGGVGGGGVVPVGGAGGRGSRGRRAAGGVVSALPLIPAAVGGGFSLGEKLAGIDAKGLSKLEYGNELMRAGQAYRKKEYGRGKSSASGQFYAQMGGFGVQSFLGGSGKRVRSEIDAFMAKTGGEGSEMGAYSMKQGALSGLSKKQKELLLAKLRGYKGMLTEKAAGSMAEAGMPTEGPFAPTPGQFNRMAGEASPRIKDLNTAISTLNKLLARGIVAKVNDPNKTAASVTDSRRKPKK